LKHQVNQQWEDASKDSCHQTQVQAMKIKLLSLTVLKNCLILMLIVAFAVIGSETVRSDIVDIVMPFYYRNTPDGTTYGGARLFEGAGYTAAGTYCAEDHRDPSGNRYVHAHLPFGFPFSHGSDTVTSTKSDWAWTAIYDSYNMESGSTFELNCFAHAASAPTVMFHPGWEAFTPPSSVCEITPKRKSYGDEGHVVVITGIYSPKPGTCVISSTSEKIASGGVYTRGWLPLGTTTDQPVKKRK
jgi:hypothetical protein